MAQLVPGLTSYIHTVVADTDTMTAMGTGGVPALAIPRLLALVDQAAIAAIAPKVKSGMTSVSTSADLDYKRPCPVGAEIVVLVELTEVDDRRLTFNFIARRKQTRRPVDDDDGVIAAGMVIRMLVDRRRFLSQAPHGTSGLYNGPIAPA